MKMRLAEQHVAVVLSQEGQAALQLAGAEVTEIPLADFFVQETDDMGMWVRVNRNDGEHSLLVRWEFVLALDLRPDDARRIGLRS
ncbi:MAG: hypothetical protein ABSF71_23175 [Terriglobia bacterium]